MALPRSNPALSGGRDAHLASMARVQHGLFTVAQAEAAGFPRRTIDRHVAIGRWERVGRGVLGWAGDRPTIRRSLAAAVLSIESAAVSHESAAHLHDVRFVTGTAVVVTAPPGTWQLLDGVRVHRYRDLTPEWITTLDGLPVTTPARTMIDLAAVLRPRRLERVLDAALDDRLDMEALLAAFNRLARRGRPGIGRMRPLLVARGEGQVVGRSALERQLRDVLADRGLPMPLSQLPAWWEGRLIGLVDFAYPRAGLLIELDGRLGHSQLVDFELDRARDQRAIAAGWQVMRITWRQLRDHPDHVVDVIRAVLERAERRGRAEP